MVSQIDQSYNPLSKFNVSVSVVKRPSVSDKNCMLKDAASLTHL